MKKIGSKQGRNYFHPQIEVKEVYVFSMNFVWTTVEHHVPDLYTSQKV